MKEVTIKVYSIDELSDEAWERALDNSRDINEHLLSDYVECIEEDLRDMHGFENVKVYYTGFGSQGDGACFVGTLDNKGLKSFFEKEELTQKFEQVYKAIQRTDEFGIFVNIKIEHTGRYYHEYMTDTNDYSEMQNNQEISGKLREEWDSFINWFDDRVNGMTDKTKGCGNGWLIQMNKMIYQRIEDQNDYYREDAQVYESIVANDIEFTEDGEEYNG